MTQDELKQKVAHAALQYIKDVPVIGVGTGSTVKYFINYLVLHTSLFQTFFVFVHHHTACPFTIT